ncbi:MAG: cytochrome c [Deltaproteobacteria bacterium]|nr:cytochrome c [Deltaproteobacteria bacterium]
MRSPIRKLCLLSLLSSGVAFAQPTAEGERIFKQKCAACHTIGAGKLVGPDLKGVAARREEAWLRRQIREPDKLIAEGDPIATQLVKEVGIPMVPLGLSEAEIDAVIAFFKGSTEGAQLQAGIPTQYLPTLLVSIVSALALTGLALRFGNKRVDVREERTA